MSDRVFQSAVAVPQPDHTAADMPDLQMAVADEGRDP